LLPIHAVTEWPSRRSCAANIGATGPFIPVPITFIAAQSVAEVKPVWRRFRQQDQ
jgi:hypothetical protein